MRPRYLAELACVLLVLGCGQPSTPERPSKASGAEADRAQVIREAEDFVRAQGYTDVPPSVSDDAIVHEGIEGTVADRRGMLEPHAVRASESGGDWVVVFRYQDARYAGRGRALKLRSGQTPAFVHQDLVLDR